MELLEKFEPVAHQRRLADNTIDAYRSWIQQFLRFLASAHGQWKRPEELGTADVEAFTLRTVGRREQNGPQGTADPTCSMSRNDIWRGPREDDCYLAHPAARAGLHGRPWPSGAARDHAAATPSYLPPVDRVAGRTCSRIRGIGTRPRAGYRSRIGRGFVACPQPLRTASRGTSRGRWAYWPGAWSCSLTGSIVPHSCWVRWYSCGPLPSPRRPDASVTPDLEGLDAEAIEGAAFEE